MPSLLVKVNKKMSLTAHRKVRTVLEGEYTSVLKGRSMDFDDLREYIPGDDVKDIDWKATARSSIVLVKRYIAIRKHNIMLVVDTGRSMAATAQSGESKRDIAVMAAGVVAAVAQKHGDLIALTAGDSQQIDHFPLKGSRSHVERILQYIDTHATLDAPTSDFQNILEYIRRSITKRMMLIMISDNLQFAAAEEQLLRRLAAQHELLFIAVDDLDPSSEEWNSKNLFDVEHPVFLPPFVRRQKEVEEAYQKMFKTDADAASHMLERVRINSVRISSEKDVINQIIRLLEKQKHAHR